MFRTVPLSIIRSFSLYTQQWYRGADKSLARPGRKQARKHVRDTHDFNMETQAAIKSLFLQGKAPKENHAILAETLSCVLPGRAKDLSAPLDICHTDLLTSRKLSVNLYDINHCCVYSGKLMMMDRGTVRNM